MCDVSCCVLMIQTECREREVCGRVRHYCQSTYDEWVDALAWLFTRWTDVLHDTTVDSGYTSHSMRGLF